MRSWLCSPCRNHIYALKNLPCCILLVPRASQARTIPVAYSQLMTCLPLFPGQLLDNQPLNLVPHLQNLVLQRRSLITRDRSRNNATADTASTTKRTLGAHEDVWHVLVFGEERDVQQDGERARVGGEDDDLGNTSVQRLGALVGALLELAVVAGLRKVSIETLYHSFRDVVRTCWVRSSSFCWSCSSASGKAAFWSAIFGCVASCRDLAKGREMACIFLRFLSLSFALCASFVIVLSCLKSTSRAAIAKLLVERKSSTRVIHRAKPFWKSPADFSLAQHYYVKINGNNCLDDWILGFCLPEELVIFACLFHEITCLSNDMCLLVQADLGLPQTPSSSLEVKKLMIVRTKVEKLIQLANIVQLLECILQWQIAVLLRAALHRAHPFPAESARGKFQCKTADQSKAASSRCSLSLSFLIASSLSWMPFSALASSALCLAARFALASATCFLRSSNSYVDVR